MAPVTTPRYRYREEKPEVITVPAQELVARLPEELRAESAGETSGGRTIDLPCAEILRGNVPRITVARLAELAGGLVRMPEERLPSDLINLPPGWIATHFRMVTRREELPPEPAGETPPPAVASAVSEPSEATKPVTPTVEPPPNPVPDSPFAAESSATASSKTTGENVPAVSPSEESRDMPAAPATDENPLRKKGFFASLPIFRRAEAIEKVSSKPPVAAAAPVPAPISPKPAEPPVSNEQPAKDPPKPVAASSVTPSPASTELVTSAPVLERLWKVDPQDELAEASALQALFMTDEKLTLEKVLSKAGELPGLDACVLAHGERVICASKAPAGTDLQTLSGQAMTMLNQIRDSSEKMGLGSVPAVTLHADRGVVSFLHRGELCLLVLHADRGFVPGVRERLQEMLGHLSEARPALAQPSAS